MNKLTLIFLCLGCQLQAQVSFTLSSAPVVGSGPSAVTTADVNGDGKPDLIGVNHIANTLSVLTNNGSGGFVTSGTNAVGGGAVSVTAADVNGDGKLDLISADSDSAVNTLTVLTNNGAGVFVLSSTVHTGRVPFSIAAADVNGDGKVDLITANYYDAALSVLTNNGSGGFVLKSSPSVGPGPVSVKAADFNGDGKVDLACVNNSANTLSVLTNNGSGGFVTSGTYGVGSDAYSVVVADVNGDGKMDLVSANNGGSTLTVLTNNGSGGFVLSSSPGVGTGPRSVTAADVNGDGKMDLISANEGASTLTVLTNNGSGGFVLATSPGVGTGPWSIAAADLNGDGKVDLITANYNNGTGNTLSVLTNGTQFPPTAPSITSQPASQTIVVGQPATNTVTVVGTAPLRYQWRFYGTNISGATNSSLVFSSSQFSNAGVYSVVASNSLGSVTSSNAVLQVLPPGAPSISANGVLAVGTMNFAAPVQVTMSGGFPGGYIYYTLDGSVPSISSPLYGGALSVTNSTTIQAMSLSADFSQTAFAPPVSVQILPVYNLQTSFVGNGSVSTSPASGPYLSNSVVALTATPSANWLFDHWTGDATGSQNPVSVTMNGPRDVQAVFLPSFPITVSTPGGGSVTVNGQSIAPGTYYPTGSVLSLAATASNGWSFLGWQGDASGKNNPLTVTLNGTSNIQAIFGTVVATNALGGGLIVLNLSNPVAFGTTLTASAVPDAGKYFVAWSGAAIGTNAPTTISITSANPAVNALFSILPGGKYSLGVAVVGNGSVGINPQKNYYNSGDTVTLSATPAPGASSFYGWTIDASGTNSPIAVVMNTNKLVQASFGASPNVTISPQNLIVKVGSNAVLNAIAGGLPLLTYQWQNSLGTIPGATNAVLTILNAQATNADNYSVVVSNPFGSVTSAVATVTVAFPPSLTAQPLPQTVAAGTPVTLSVTNLGTPSFYYQWFDSLGSIPGATNSSYTLNPAQTNDWDNYFVIVTNAYGAVTSTVTPLIVYGPVTIDAQPLSQVVPLNAPASFGVIASGFPAPVYRWTFNGTNLTGATSNSLTIPNVHLSNEGYYQVLINNGYSTNNSYLATLNVSPSLTAPFSGASTVWGNSAVLSVGAVGSGTLTYQWFKDGVAINGATENILNFGSIEFTNAGLYTVVVSSPFGSVTNTAYQVIVNPANIALGFYPGLTIGGVAGYSYIIQSTTNLGDINAWVTLTNLTLTQPVQLWVDTNVDASSPFNSKTFYKILPGQ